MTDEEADPETITVKYSNGTTETFSNCTGYTNDGKLVTFTGQLNGQDPPPKKHEISFVNVLRITRE
jgi:hypothetical protein